PPVPFALLVMGSGGRGESLIGADQDNGLILADYDDTEHDRIDAWFREFSAMFCEMLDTIGLPYCRGGVMASNPLWRKTISQWREQVDGWLRRRSAAMLRLADIFFDFTAVWGERALAEDLRDHVMSSLPRSHAFLQAMHAEQRDHATALGWFGRLRTRDEAPNHHALNLKYDAGLPLVESLRLLGLANGVAATGTPARLAALVERGHIKADTGEALHDAFAVITGLMLRQQIADFREGREPDYWLDPDGLSSRERQDLIGALRAIEGLRDRVASDFTADLF
ncbi:MAG: putative nucleotidyltransferase substrate binding domain-containing protein, partial [Alphaproteobacteria bacterium]|nr:putative nucleotidyltransferase substrate binding domain-containing protein [Alphaproteobacteria bacterium]